MPPRKTRNSSKGKVRPNPLQAACDSLRQAVDLRPPTPVQVPTLPEVVTEVEGHLSQINTVEDDETVQRELELQADRELAAIVATPISSSIS